MTIYGDDILDAAYAAVDIPSTAYSSDTFIKHIVNKGLSRLHYTLADAEIDWYADTKQFSVVSGTASYDLPGHGSDSTSPKFYKLRYLYLRDGNYRYQIPKFQRSEIDGWDVAPRASGTLDMLYIPEFTPLDATDDDWSDIAIDTRYPAGWEDYPALFTAVRLAIKDESFELAAALAAERDACLAEILARCSPRDTAVPDRVRDVSARWANRCFDGSVEDLAYRIEGGKLELIRVPYIAGV